MIFGDHRRDKLLCYYTNVASGLKHKLGVMSFYSERVKLAPYTTNFYAQNKNTYIDNCIK